MTKTGTINNVTVVKEGVTNNRSWSLKKVTLEDGFTAVTFEDIYNDQIGKNVSLEVEKDSKVVNGKTYDNYKIVPSKPRRGGGAPSDAVTMKLFEKLDKIDQMVARVLNQVGANGDKPQANDIDASNLPF